MYNEVISDCKVSCLRHCTWSNRVIQSAREKPWFQMPFM